MGFSSTQEVTKLIAVYQMQQSDRVMAQVLVKPYLHDERPKFHVLR